MTRGFDMGAGAVIELSIVSPEYPIWERLAGRQLPQM
jgi:hypothetical protein